MGVKIFVWGFLRECQLNLYLFIHFLSLLNLLLSALIALEIDFV